MSLAQHWRTTWSDLGLREPDAVLFQTLLERYSEPARAYHTPQHLEECFSHFDRTRELAREPGEVAMALWFHDAIYDTRSSRNEDDSADWADSVLATAGGATEVRERVRALILGTKHSGALETDDARLTIDIDLSILGASPHRFAEYEAQVRREFAWVPDEPFRAARARILSDFLGRPAIYSTEYFHARLETKARANLRESLARLA